MELFGVSEKDEECLRLYLEDQFGDCNATDIHYFADKQMIAVPFVNDCAVDHVLKGSRFIYIEEKKYRTRKLYSAELLDISNAESALQYLCANIGNVVHHKHFPNERRLVVAFDEEEAIKQLCEQERHMTMEGATFRVQRLSKSQQECRQPPNQQQQQQQHLQPQQLLQQQQQQHLQQQHLQQQHLKQQHLKQQQFDPHMQTGDMNVPASHAVTVSNIPEKISKATLELRLTNQWKDVGISYKHVDYNPSAGLALVSFSATQEIRKVVHKEGHDGIPWPIAIYNGSQRVCDVLGDVVLLIEIISPEFSTEALWCWMKIVAREFAHTIVYSSDYKRAAAIFTYSTNLDLDEVANNARIHAVDGCRLHVTAIRHTRRAHAVNLSDSVSKSMLKKHLEDSQNGGIQGSVEHLEMQCPAVITFSNECALRHAMSRKHVLLDQEFWLAPLFDDFGSVNSCQQVWKFDEMKQALIEAHGVTALPTELTITGFDSQQINEHILRQFLSQRRLSGGGEIKNFSWKSSCKDKAVVTFVDSECAMSIYQKFQCESLQLCGYKLSASLRTFDTSDDAYKNQVLLRNIGVASDDSMKYWLWGITDNQVHRLDFFQKNKDLQYCAVAHFERDIDFGRLLSSLKSVTLDRLHVEADFISRPRSILAANIPDGTHHHLVDLCFGKFGNVQKVREIAPQKWVVTFCQSEDAARALRETIFFHGANNKVLELQTSLYMDCQVLGDARKTNQRRRLTLPLNFVDQAVVAFVLSTKKADLDGMLQPFGSTVSTDEENGAPAVVCTLSQSNPCYRDAVQRWNRLRKDCDTFFSRFQSKSISVSTNVYEALIASERFLSISNQSKQDLLVTTRDRPLTEIIIAGSSQAMEDACSAMQSLVRDISDSVERSKQRVTLVTDHLEESALKLLDSVGFCRNARKRYTELNVDSDWGNQVIRFEGLPEDIAASKEELQRILSGSSEDTIKGSVAMLKLLGKEKIRQFVDEQLNLKKLMDVVVWYVEPSIGICVRGVDPQSTQDAANIIRTQIIDMPIALDVDSVQLMASEKWETFSKDIIQKYHDNFVLNKLNSTSDQSGAVLQLSCTITHSERVAEEVKEFLRRHTLKEDFVSLPCSTVEFLTKFMQDSIISQVENLLSRNFVKMHPVIDSELAKVGFQIVGNQDGIINARRTLAHLLKTHKVSTKKHQISSPGAEQHFKSHEAVLSRIGKETKTIICVSSGSEEEMQLNLDESGLLLASQVILPCGTELHVLRGDILQLNCDAIVNPANSELQHSGGLAAVIAKHGGQIIREECEAFVRERGQLVVTQVCVTAAGALHCKKVIHAVGPQWQGGTRSEANRLFWAVQNSLAAAVQHGCTSIAIPPISSGIFSYPLEKCTRTIVESVIDFCANATDRLKKIILVDNKSDGAKHFTKAVDQLVQKTTGAEAEARDSASLPPTALQLSSRTHKKFVEPDKKFEMLLDARGMKTHGQIILPCGTELRVMKCDIVQQTCDGIVNPTNGQLQLRGGLAAIIADKGGPNILNECAAYIRDHGQLSDGQVCVTAAGALHCKKVVHAVGPLWLGGSRNEANKLFYAVRNSLAAAVQHGLTSIAIPPISSGIFGYPLEKCTRTIAESVIEFCKSAAKAPRTIILIDNKTEGAEFFKKAVDQLLNNTNDTAAVSVTQGSPSSFLNAPQTTFTTQGDFNDPGQAVLTAAQRPLTIGSAVVELIVGSLVDQKVDVMVNTVGCQLLLQKGALSRSVGDAAGPAMQQYLTNTYKNGLATGEFVISDGFKLPCQHVLHCCCSQWNSGNAKQVLSDVLLKCLTEAARLGMSSIAIPAIGTGQLGFPPQESAKTTYEAVLQYCRSHPSTSVRHVKIVVHSPPSVVAAYQEQHAAAIRNNGVFATLQQPRSTTSTRGRGTVGTDSLSRGSKGEASFSVTLSICGKEDDIVQAVKAVEEYCQKSIAERVLRGFEDSIKMLSGSQVDELVQHGVENGCAVEVDHRDGSVKIRSLERSAANAVFTQVQTDMACQKMEHLQQENIASRCQWQFKETSGQWQDYEASLNAKLEHAFRKNETSFSYASADGPRYIVNFKEMKDCAEGNSFNSAEIQRVDKELGFLLNLTDKNEKYSEEVVPIGSPEYDSVKDAFFKTAKSAAWNIVEIKKVRNLFLREKYRIHEIEVKHNMQGNTAHPIERWLWHGTKEESLLQICKEGFNRSYCGVNGTKYGKGVYFARDSSYSADKQYSVPNATGLKHMLYCRVLTGEFVLGEEFMKAPPHRPRGSQAKYESSVDNVKDPTVFVVYHDAQAYPLYIVKFR